MAVSEPFVVAEIAGAVLDGTPIDWAAAGSSVDETNSALLEQLRVLATLADLHRRLPLHVAAAPLSAVEDRGEELKHWGHLRVLERIGRGAFGDVYRAWDTRLDREVALKLLPADPSDADSRGTSIIDEGRLLARVRHPNVVTIYGAEQIGRRIGLWMEFVRGRTLQQILEEGKVFSATEGVGIGLDLCHALSAVHGAGILHRDIKAHNVMLAEDGRLVLMDFGTGRELSDDSAAVPAGTPLYLAPELFRGEAPSVSSEIYSLGVLLCRLVTGSYPVRAPGLRELRAAHERGERTGVRTLRPDLPRGLARIVQHAIDPEPKRRYHSVAALEADLSALKLRPRILRFAYASGVAAAAGALVLGGWLLADGRLRQTRRPASTQPTFSVTPGVPRRSDAPAIAVLPLKNLGTESGSEEFVDGLTEEIINSLATSEHLQVRSRASCFAFKNKPRDLQDVTRQLDVNLVLEGSGRRSGNRFQIETRLVQASSGLTLWNESFESDLGGVFAVRDRITRGVVSRLGLAPGRASRGYDVNPEAYGRYLTARALVSRRGVVSPQKAVEFFQQVIAIDPGFAPAYAGLADAYAYMSIPTYQGMPFDQAQELMRKAALKALELDPSLAEAHAAMGIVYSGERNWADSQQQFQQAIALNPSLSQVYTSYSFFTLRPLEKFDEAEQLVRVARRNDPLSLDVWREMAQLHFTVGRYDEAISLLERVRAVDPEFPFADMWLARALVFRGRIDDALALYDAMEANKPAGYPPTASRVAGGVSQYLALAYVRAGRRADAERLAAANHEYPYRATIIYAALGDLDRAFEALDRTAEREPQRVPLLLTWPEMAPLRADPRLAAFRKRFGLP